MQPSDAAGRAPGYVAIGAPEAFGATKRLSRLLGIELVPSPQPGAEAWAWRTPLGLDPNWYSELVVPNPRYRGRHPLHLALTEGPPLQTLCWAYAAPTAFAGLSAVANRLKRSFSWLEPLHSGETGPMLGFLGPGLRTDLPALLFEALPPGAPLHPVTVRSVHGVLSGVAMEKAVFAGLGLNIDLVEGDPEVRVVLGGPGGTLTLSSPPVAFGGPS